jgi:hypothetical protein
MAVKVEPEPKLLTWGHFRKIEKPPESDPWDAHTSPEYDLQIPPKGGIVKDGTLLRVQKLTITVTPDSTRSWVVKSKQTQALLDHERGHWMMDIVVGHEMHDAILALRGTGADDLKKKINAEFDWHREKREKWLADKYDDETKHGADAKAQQQWAAKILGWHNALKIEMITPR